MATSDSNLKLAVLIDAENAPAAIVGPLLAEIATVGTAHVRRAYGDWTGTTLAGWKRHLLEHSVQPIQQFSYTQGKNSSDSAMIIDAMDLMYSGRFGGFCIVSSDSDFTRLAARIRESGLTVFGFGESKTPRPFRAACDRFTYLENLGARTHTASTPRNSLASRTDTAVAPGQVGSRAKDPDLLAPLRDAVGAASGDDGWAALANVGNILIKRQPDFDARTFGYSKLSDLVRAVDVFETTSRSPGEGKPGVMYVRARSDPALP